MATLQLARGRDARLRKGHPWVYRTEVSGEQGTYTPGDIVDIVDAKGHWLAKGYVNPASQIIARVLTTDRREEIDREFWRKRLARAWAYRQKVLSDTTSCRVAFAEADGLPGLIVDKFEDMLVVQSLTLGIAVRQDLIVDLLDELLAPKGIYARNDAPVRELEGLTQEKGLLKGILEPLLFIRENGLSIKVDVVNGQKTGHFLDQRENRAALRPYVKGGRVLDAFCHTGGFALNAAIAGAESVVALDISEEALATASENAALNDLSDRIEFRKVNVFDYLRELELAHARFDCIILDPPAFAKSHSALAGATRGYKEINLRALKLLVPGGFLITCSCSFHMRPELFREIIQEAALDAKRQVHLVEERAQAHDHPILLGYQESHYLKCLICQVV